LSSLISQEDHIDILNYNPKGFRATIQSYDPRIEYIPETRL